MEYYGELDCTVNIEAVNQTGRQASKRKTINNTNIQIGRNEFKDLILKVERDTYEFKNYQILSRFIKEGKATIIFNKNVNIMLCNAPPDKLAAFLKILKIKSSLQKSFATDRMKLYSSQSVFEDISPLTIQDVKTYKLANKSVNTKSPLQITSSSTKCNKLTDKTPVRIKRRHPNNDENSAPRKRLSNQSPVQLIKLGTSKSSLKSKASLNQSISNITNTQTLKKKLNLTGQLTSEQKEVLKAVKNGLSIFFTGSAGTGKSYLLRKIIGALPPDTTCACASTGVAACQIGGITLHSFAGIGSGEGTLEQCMQLASRPAVTRNWKRCKILIIDEISMIDCQLFDKLEKIGRVIRGDDRPFGGIQVILCGDFLQLPPVKKTKDYQFCFQSKRWESCVQRSFELTEVKRQSDQEFINILQHIRVGKCPDVIYDRLLQSQYHDIEKEGVQATRLCTHKDSAEEINREKMNELTSECKVYMASDSDVQYSTQLDKMLPVLNKLELKVGAQIMLTKNLDVNKGLVNGARGVVTKFQQGLPLVKFVQGEELLVKREKFVTKLSSGIISRVQLPLKLAWAISIHKSQGLTLDCCEVSLSRVFEHGQAYVALSRAKSLQGLRVIDMSRTCVRANKEVLKFYIRLRREIRLSSIPGKEDQTEYL